MAYQRATSPNTNYGQYLGVSSPRRPRGADSKTDLRWCYQASLLLLGRRDPCCCHVPCWWEQKLEAVMKPVFVSKIPWHSGAEWVEFLSMYDASVAENLGHCQHRHRRYGSTMVHAAAMQRGSYSLTVSWWTGYVDHVESLRIMPSCLIVVGSSCRPHLR